MPELVEVERYRRMAERIVGCTIERVQVLDPLAVRGQPPDMGGAIAGRPVTGARRRGKLLLLDTGPRRAGPTRAACETASGGPTLGLRFGMTGTLVVDGAAPIERLLHSSASHDERWVRFRMELSCARHRTSELVLHDPRRLGRVLLDPDEAALGPDALAVTRSELRRATGAGTPPRGAPVAALKARLLDQRRLAGVGNLIADEVLWRASLSPHRAASLLTEAEVRRLHRYLLATIADLVERGGSHTGDLMTERHVGGRCPKDGAPLVRSTVGGRTTWWCGFHQR